MNIYKETIEVKNLDNNGYHTHHILAASAIDSKDELFELKDDILFECEADGNKYKVQINGEVSATVELACDRCSQRFEKKIGNKFRVTYLPVEYLPVTREEVRIYEKELDVAYYSDGIIELQEILHEQLILLIPVKKLCNENCKGICSWCGCNLNEEQCNCHEVPDGRWEPLKKLMNK